VFVDFMLGKYSPVKYHEKRLVMGSSYYTPDFGPLVNLVGIMTKRTDLTQ